MDPILYAGFNVGEYRRSREGAPNQVRRTSEVGATLYHGVPSRSPAVCTPPFCRRPYSLSLGYRHARCAGDTRRHRHWLHVLPLHSRSRHNLERLPFPDALIRFSSQGVALDEGSYSTSSCLVEAMVHRAPVADRANCRGGSPIEPHRTLVQGSFLPGSHRGRGRRRCLRQALHYDTFKLCILEA